MLPVFLSLALLSRHFALAFFQYQLWPLSVVPTAMPEAEKCTMPFEDPDPHDYSMRTVIIPSPTTVTAYPSMGGIVFGFFYPPELEILNISRTTSSRRSAVPAEEDDLAARILRLGANWWPNYAFYARHRKRIYSERIPYDYHFPPIVHVGVPKDGQGVWVFKHSADDQTFDDQHPRQPYLEQEPDDWRERIEVATSMDARCQVIKDFGGTYYENAEDCPDLPNSLQEGVARGKRYQALMEKMDDWHYIDKFLEGE